MNRVPSDPTAASERVEAAVKQARLQGRSRETSGGILQTSRQWRNLAGVLAICALRSLQRGDLGGARRGIRCHENGRLCEPIMPIHHHTRPGHLERTNSTWHDDAASPYAFLRWFNHRRLPPKQLAAHQALGGPTPMALVLFA